MKEITLDIERKWGTQRTTMTVYGQGEDKQDNVLKVSTSLEDVMRSVKEKIDSEALMDAIKNDIGSVTWVFTEKEFDKRFDAAVAKTDFYKIFDAAVKLVLQDIGKATKSHAGEIPG